MSEQILPVETQEFLSNEIKKYNIADEKIAELKEQFKDLKIASVDDKENYKAVQDAISILRPLRTSIEKKRKELNEVPIVYKKAVDGEAKRLTELIEEIEKPLKEQKDFIDEEKERIKKEELEQKEVIINTRINSLVNNGASFNGTHYKIIAGEDEAIVSIVDIRNLENEAFEIIEKKFIEIGDVLRKELADAQEQQRLESEKIIAEREKFEKDKKELEAQRIALEKEASEMQQKKAEIEKQLLQARAKQLDALGYKYNFNLRQFEFKNECGIFKVKDDEVLGCDAEQWNVLFQNATNERIRLNDLMTEKTRILEAEMLEAQKIALEKAQEEEKRLAEEAEALRHERLPDVEKVHEYINQFSKILEVFPEIKSKDVQVDFDFMYNQISGAISRFEQKYPRNEVK